MALVAGTNLGPYEILSLLGSGAMGEVYRARDPRLGREVAIKVLPDHLAGNPEALVRFEREAKALASLSHPNILAIHDFSKDRDLYFAVMELLNGDTLRSRLHAGPLPWKKALEIGIAIAEGLSAAHSRGVIHRDLKPENIFLTTEGLVKILDFGLARTKEILPRSRETEPGTVLGTVDYMSPEQVQGFPADERSDIFSFGCILFEMLTGKCPFARHDLGDTLIAILKEDASFPATADIPFGVERMVLHCLEKNSEQRFQSARDLAYDLRAIWHDSSILKTAVIPTAKSKPNRKRFVYAVLAIAMIVAAAAGILFYSNLQGRESLAVLPFHLDSANPETEYLVDGITENIITNLSQLPKLRVKARSTVFRYKGKEVDPQEVGKTLDVRAVLIGRVFEKDESLTIRTELVQVRDGSQLWGGQYTKRMSDLFSVDQEISSHIAERLKLNLTSEEKKQIAKKHTISNEAYQNYLKGRYYWNKRTSDGIKQAIEFFELAIDSDPNYALAYAGLSDCYNLLTDYAGVPPNETFPRAKAAARKALEIDETVAEAHVSLAHAYFSYDWDWKVAEAEYRRGIELSPNYATGHHWYGWYWAMRGNHQEALSRIQQAQELDPLSMIINANAGLFHYFAHNYQDAIRQYEKTLAIDPNVSLVHYYLGMAYEQQGELSKALTAYQKAYTPTTKSAGIISAMGRIYALLEDKPRAKEFEDRLNQLAQESYISACIIARIPIALGEEDRAFELLGKAYQDRDELLLWLKVDPRFEPIRKDPRFQSLLNKINFP
jgi:serine/threonine-protein kinase